jgi:hypothetical protein
MKLPVYHEERQTFAISPDFKSKTEPRFRQDEANKSRQHQVSWAAKRSDSRVYLSN